MILIHPLLNHLWKKVRIQNDLLTYADALIDLGHHLQLRRLQHHDLPSPTQAQRTHPVIQGYSWTKAEAVNWRKTWKMAKTIIIP